MIGLDFGSTTSSAMVAVAEVNLNSVTGRMALGDPQVTYRSDSVFTPFDGDMIDELCLKGYLERWLAESNICQDDLFSGGVIITGMAARQRNAARIAKLVGKMVGETIIATADDPNLESWLSFMGCSSALSRYHSEQFIINLDIGGGTTNPALGKAGQVSETGCFFVGARHFQFEPGGYLLKHVSHYGKKLLDHFSIAKNPGDSFERTEINKILDFYIASLEAIVSGDGSFFDLPIAKLHQQVSFDIKNKHGERVITFSGGVGELLNHISLGKTLPGTTYYGDLGIDLAERIADSAILSSHLRTHRPENMGRATVYGLTLHNTEISGSTLFFSHPDLLPLKDIPIVARLNVDGDLNEVLQALSMVVKSPKGACIQVISNQSKITDNPVSDVPGGETFARIKSLGLRIAEALGKVTLPQNMPLIILVPDNYGKALGNYVTNWRQSTVNLTVVDEIPDRHAHFVNIGQFFNNIVPVSFYGIH